MKTSKTRHHPASRTPMILPRRQALALSEIAQTINATLELDILLRLILLEITKMLECQAGDIWLKEEKVGEMIFQTSLGLSPALRGLLLNKEPASRTLVSGEPEWARVDSQIQAEALRAGIASWIALPLKTKGKLIGIMHFYAKHQRKISAAERQLLKILSSQAALAIENARMFEETKRKARELLALYEIARVISEMSNLDSALGHIAERVGSVLNVEKCWFMFYEAKRQRLEAHPSAVGLSEDQLAALRLSIDSAGVSTEVFRTSRPMYTNQAEHEPLVAAEFHDLFTLANLMAVPLRSQEHTLGVFLAANKKDKTRFSGNDVRFFVTLASETAMIIQNASLFAKTRESYLAFVRRSVEYSEPKNLRGHAGQVAEYAAQLAQGLHLSYLEAEKIKLAGLLHDFGKNLVPEKIKDHATAGAEWLGEIAFPWNIQALVRHHHERFDGHGWPKHLAGEEIPLGARIIAVADRLEHLSRKGNFFGGKNKRQLLAQLKREAGSRLDPQLVNLVEKNWPLGKMVNLPAT